MDRLGKYLKQYIIGGIKISCSGCCNLGEDWSAFQSDFREDPDIDIRWLYQGNDFYGVNFFHVNADNYILKNESSILITDYQYDTASICAEPYEKNSPLLVLLICAYLSKRRGAQIHSSLVDYHGNGIMFLGPSGIGKTTQAELWHKFLGADIINGDMVFVRENPDGFYGYGSPWHGASPYCMNKKVKLKALVTLEQAPETTLTRASGVLGIGKVIQQVYLPNWDEKATEQCLDTLNDLLEQVPVYYLACRPDKDSVKILQTQLHLS